MYDFKKQIAVFIEANFKNSTPEDANFKVTSTELLNFLFNTFPKGCIDDYDLNEIMTKLKYTRHNYIGKDNNDKECLKSSWCMHSDLITEETK